MASQTRGSIEEGLSQFEHDTEKNITFDGATIGKAGFNSPPVVKLISASKYPPTLLSNQKHLLYDASGNFVPTFPDTDEGDVTVATTNSTVESGYNGTINSAANIVGKVRRLADGDLMTVPFDNSMIKDNSIVQIFFQARFHFWDGVEGGSNDNFGIFFVNETAIKAATDATITASSEGVGVKCTLFINKINAQGESNWRVVTNQGPKSAMLTQVYRYQIADIVSNEQIPDDGVSPFHWFRLDVTKTTSAVSNAPTHDLRKFAGIHFKNFATAASEKLDIADFFVFVWDGETMWEDAGTHNYLASPVSEISNSNIGVTFTNITVDDMKIQTTAPFTGWIRYLCSVQG